MNDKIKQLREQIKQEEAKMRNCSHEFGEPFYNPEIVKEADGYKLEGRGSDPYPVATGYHDVEKQRWTRACKKCGMEQHTSTQEPIVAGYKPKFQ